MDTPSLPETAEPTGRSKTFDQDTVPGGLLAQHDTRAGVWGKLIVEAGGLDFVRAAQPDDPIRAVPGQPVVIQPGDPHFVRLTGPVRFHIQFYKAVG